MIRQLLCGIWVCGSIFLYSCAPATYYSRGHAFLEVGDYPQATQQFKLAIAEDYRNIDAIRDMGVAVYHTGKLNLAQSFLKLALTRIPNDPMANYYLGIVYEEKGMLDDAIKQYSKYTEISPFNDLRRTVEGRLLVLVRRQMAEQIKALLAQDQAMDVSQMAPNSIAVLYFTNLTQNPDWTPLQKGLTDMIITDLSQTKSITVVERARMQMLLDEMGLGMSGLVKESTAPRMGKLLGIARVVQGAFAGADADDVHIDASLADMRSGINVQVEKIAGSLQEFYQLEKDLTFNIIEAMGVKLTSEEKESIQKVPTKNLLAFMAYCRGLDYEDKREFDLAQNEFKAAVNIDPGFARAQTGLDRSKAFSNFSSKPIAPPVTAFRGKGAGSEGPLQAKDGTKPPLARPETVDLMARTASNVTPGFFLGIESRKPSIETGESSTDNVVHNIELKIHIPIKR